MLCLNMYIFLNWEQIEAKYDLKTLYTIDKVETIC